MDERRLFAWVRMLGNRNARRAAKPGLFLAPAADLRPQSPLEGTRRNFVGSARGVNPATLPALALGLAAAIAPAGHPALSPSARAATTFVVNTTADHDDGACLPAAEGDCTLREAFVAANALSGPDRIEFAIPGGGVQTIRPATALPAITDPLTVDGYSQPGAKPNTAKSGTNAKLLIQLDGGQAPPGTHGLRLQGDDTTVRGLVISAFAPSSPLFNGFAIEATGSNFTIAGNFIGTNPAGTAAAGNGRGIVLRPNGPGQVGSRIGGSSRAERNLIAGNDFEGVVLFSDDNEVVGNLIGTDKSGTTFLGNGFTGLAIDGGSRNLVARNVVAFNDLGVTVLRAQSAGNRLDRNRIFANDGLGIDLGGNGPTPNDGGNPPDTDDGPNRLQNAPVLTSAKSTEKKTTVKGKLAGAVREGFFVQLFANPKAKGAEGRTFLAETRVVTGNGGKASFTVILRGKKRLPLGQAITATATHSDTDDTSEFSKPEKVKRRR